MEVRHFTNVSSFSPDKPIRRSGVVKEQRERSPGLSLATQVQLCYHKSENTVKEFEPFSLSGQEAKPHSEGASFSFRTD